VIRVKLTTSFPDWPLIRQTPGSKGRWGDCEFSINDDLPECDWWVVYDDLCRSETTICPVGQTVLITGEPPTAGDYPPAYLRQFGWVRTSHPNLGHANVILTQQGQPWHIGRRQRNHCNLGFWLDFDQLQSLQPPAKTKCLSVVCSNLALTEGHRRRSAFVRRLAQHFKNRLDVFGRGLSEVEDKWEALREYRYHIVLENSVVPHYWTEKLADAYLGWTYPFYWGCPNLIEYFPVDAFTPIDILDPDSSIQKIEWLIAHNTYEKRVNQILQCRNLILNKYNLFAMLASFSAKTTEPPRQRIELQPQSVFSRREFSGVRAVAKAQAWVCGLLNGK